MKKKILLTLAMALMLVCVLAFSVSAADYVDDNGIKYTTTSSTTAKVADSRSTLTGTQAIIAEKITIDGTEYTVTAVDSNAFNGLTSLQTIYFPPTITKLGSSTFSSCSGLTAIYIDFANLTEIGTLGFSTGTNQNGYSNVKNDITIYSASEYGADAPAKMVTANFANITNFGWAACQGLNVENVIVGESLTYLQRQIFRGSTMKTVVLSSENLTRIDHYSLNSCSNLETVTIKSRNLTTIENNVFSNSTKVTSISIDLSKCTSIEANAFTFSSSYDGGNTTTQWYNLEGQKVVDLTNIKTLGGSGNSGAFASSNLGSADTIVWPEEITSFSGQVFRKANLKSIYLNAPADKSFSIDYYTVDGCPLTKVVIGNGFVVNFKLSQQCTAVFLGDSTTVSRNDVFTQSGSKLYYVALSGNTSLSNCEMIQIKDGTFLSSICGFDCAVTLADGTKETVFEAVHTYNDGVVNEEYCPIGAVVDYTCQLCKALKTEGEGTEHSHTVTVIVYNQGFLNAGLETYRCAGAGCTSTLAEGTATLPIFINHGYSASEASGSITQGFVVNREAYKNYVNAGGNLTFGLVAAVYSNATGFDTTDGKLFGADGVKKHDKIAVVDFTSREYDIMEMVVTGLNNYQDTPIYCCLYYVSDGQVGYINEGVEGETATAKTLSGVIGSEIEAVVPNKEEE